LVILVSNERNNIIKEIDPCTKNIQWHMEAPFVCNFILIRKGVVPLLVLGGERSTVFHGLY